jgi:hypothetical protein
MKKQTPNSEKRREFLRTSVAAGAGASVIAAVPGAALAADTEISEPVKEENYRVTRHISDYYKSTL